MADDPKKLAEAQEIANEAIKEGTDLTKILGTLLDKQLEKSAKYNALIKNRVKIINDDLKAQKSSIPLMRGAFTNQLNILRTQNKIAKARSKTGQFQKGYNNSVVEGLKTDLAGLKANKEKISLQGLQQEANTQINKGFAVGAAIFASLVAVALKFAHKIDEIGSSFGSLNVLGENFQDTLIAQGNSVTAIGGSLADVASITNTLASSFGMNVDEASKLSGKVFDTGKALGISADEGTKLFGTLINANCKSSC